MCGNDKIRNFTLVHIFQIILILVTDNILSSFDKSTSPSSMAINLFYGQMQ